MKSQTTINLDVELKKKIIKKAGYGKMSQYITELVKADMEKGKGVDDV